jgi:hypothetical protein
MLVMGVGIGSVADHLDGVSQRRIRLLIGTVPLLLFGFNDYTRGLPISPDLVFVIFNSSKILIDFPLQQVLVEFLFDVVGNHHFIVDVLRLAAFQKTFLANTFDLLKKLLFFIIWVGFGGEVDSFL